MEEQKNEVKMGVVKSIDEQEPSQEKRMPTFDELYATYMELAQKYQYAVQRLQQAEKYIQTINRLDYLFRVLEASNKNSNYAFDPDFVNKCIEEIQGRMTIPEEGNKETQKGN